MSECGEDWHLGRGRKVEDSDETIFVSSGEERKVRVNCNSVDLSFLQTVCSNRIDQPQLFTS